MMKFLKMLVLPMVLLAACSTNDNKGDKNPDTGFLIVNEGSYGKTMGSVNRANVDSTTIEVNVAGELGKTTCYGVKWDRNYYFVSKQGQRLIKSDAGTMVQTAVLEQIGGDGRAFVGIDKQSGVVSTLSGAFKVVLAPLALGDVIEPTRGAQCGGLYSAGGYLYVINQNKGLQIFSIAKGYELKKEVAGVTVGFAKAKDGSLWCAGENFLVQINLQNLSVKELELPSDVKIYDSWGSWNAGSLCASVTDNALFFAKSANEWGGGNQVYKYTIDGGAVTTFATSSDESDSFYGASIGVDPHTGDIVALMVGGDDYNDNRLVIFDGKTGAEKSRINYMGYYFPSMIVFNR